MKASWVASAALVGVVQEAPGKAVAGALVVLHDLCEGRSVPPTARAMTAASSGSGCVRCVGVASGGSAIGFL